MFSLVTLLAFLTTPPQKPTFEVLAHQAQGARDSHNLEEAAELYQEALALRPDRQDRLWKYGAIAYHKNSFSEFTPAFRRLSSLTSTAPVWTIPVVVTKLDDSHHKTPQLVVAAGLSGLRKEWLPKEVPESDCDVVCKPGEATASPMERDPKTATAGFEALVIDRPDVFDGHFRYGAYLLQDDMNPGIGEIWESTPAESDQSKQALGEHQRALTRASTSQRSMAHLAEKLTLCESGPNSFGCDFTKNT